MVRSVPTRETLFIGNLSGNVGTSNVGFEVAYGGFGYVCRNQEGQDILEACRKNLNHKLVLTISTVINVLLYFYYV